MTRFATAWNAESRESRYASVLPPKVSARSSCAWPQRCMEPDRGFIPFLISTARRTGFSGYVAEGANRWPAVHRQDAATLYRLAVEKASAGSRLHGTGESAVTFETIAHLIGRMLKVPVVSVASDKAVEHFQNPFVAKAFVIDSPVSSAYTRKLLGWKPIHSTLLQDLEEGDYFSAGAASAFDKAGH